LCLGVGATNFGKVGVGNFGNSEWEIFENRSLESDPDSRLGVGNLPPAKQNHPARSPFTNCSKCSKCKARLVKIVRKGGWG